MSGKKAVRKKSFLDCYGLETGVALSDVQPLAVRAWMHHATDARGVSCHKLSLELNIPGISPEGLEGNLSKYLKSGKPAPTLAQYPTVARGRPLEDSMPLPLRVERVAPGGLRILLHPLWLLLAVPRDIEAALFSLCERSRSAARLFMRAHMRQKLSVFSREGEDPEMLYKGALVSWKLVTDPPKPQCPYDSLANFLMYVYLCRAGKISEFGPFPKDLVPPPRVLFRGSWPMLARDSIGSWYDQEMAYVEERAMSLVDGLPAAIQPEIRQRMRGNLRAIPFAWTGRESEWAESDAFSLIRAMKGTVRGSPDLLRTVKEQMSRLHDYQVRAIGRVG